MKTAIGLLNLSLLMLAACTPEAPAPVANSAGKPPYITLDQKLTDLRADFNAMDDKLRLVFLSGPSCGICLRGMDDLNESIVQSLQDDPRVHTFVVYLPTLGAEEKHAAAAVALMQGSRIDHYWDGKGESGLLFQEALDIDAYAWDIWMLYEPGARWSADAAPPPPPFWQHQLMGLPDEQRLDADEFAAEVTARLADLPAAPPATETIAAPDGSAVGSGGEVLAVAQPAVVMIRHNHRSRGGYDQLKAITRIRYYGETLIGGRAYPLTVETRRPQYYERTIGVGEDNATVVWDGSEVVRTGAASGPPTAIPEEFLTSWEFDGWITEWKDKGHSLRRLGMKKLDDRLPWLMEAELANGRTWHIYVDSHTGDAFRQALIGPNGEESVVLEFSDYREANGFRLPHRVDYHEGDERVATDRFERIVVETAGGQL